MSVIPTGAFFGGHPIRGNLREEARRTCTPALRAPAPPTRRARALRKETLDARRQALCPAAGTERLIGRRLGWPIFDAFTTDWSLLIKGADVVPRPTEADLQRERFAECRTEAANGWGGIVHAPEQHGRAGELKKILRGSPCRRSQRHRPAEAGLRVKHHRARSSASLPVPCSKLSKDRRPRPASKPSFSPDLVRVPESATPLRQAWLHEVMLCSLGLRGAVLPRLMGVSGRRSTGGPLHSPAALLPGSRVACSPAVIVAPSATPSLAVSQPRTQGEQDGTRHVRLPHPRTDSAGGL